MNSNINELIEPQIGKQSPVKKVEKGKTDTESSSKRIRQAVYDIRYRARREGIKLDQAFNQYMAHTNMSGIERTSVKEKLGLIAGQNQSSIGEEYIDEAPHLNKYNKGSNQKFKVRVSDKQSGKTYVRYATRAKIEQLRKNPNISSVEMTQYGEPYEGEKAKGKQTAAAKSGRDWDEDGNKESPAKEYRGVVHNAIQRRTGQKPDGKDTSNVKENFSNWRTDLIEVVDKIENSNKVDDKKVVDNHRSKVVIINPEIKEGIQILEMVELPEEYLVETVNVATEYFFNAGLNEDGLEIVIEELGLEKFNNFVFYVTEKYNLDEARAARKARKGAKSYDEVKAEIDAKEAAKKKIIIDKGSKTVQKAKESQGSKKPVRDAIARGVFSAINAYQQGVERHKAATATAGKALKVAAKGASEFGKGVTSGVKTTAKVAKSAHKVLNNSYDMEEAINPYAVGMAAAMKQTGDTPPLNKSTINKAHRIAKKVEQQQEAISPVPGQQSPSQSTVVQKGTEQIQAKNAQAKLDRVLMARRALQNAQRDAIKSGANISASYEPEGDMIDERTRQRKGQPRPERNRALEIVRSMPEIEKGAMTRSGGTVAQHKEKRGVKKTPGAPTPTGETTADRLAAKRQRQAAQVAARERAEKDEERRRRLA